jgi:hypothetical protein
LLIEIIEEINIKVNGRNLTKWEKLM